MSTTRLQRVPQSDPADTEELQSPQSNTPLLSRQFDDAGDDRVDRRRIDPPVDDSEGTDDYRQVTPSQN
jgi:hypothetical protein